MRQFEKTSTKVMHILHRNGAMSIAEIADVLFVDESNIRRALYKLTEQGVVQAIAPQKKDGPGRPTTRYVNLSSTPTSTTTGGSLWPSPSQCGALGR